MKSDNIIVLENLRSAYNVWNIIRTADALWWTVFLSGYTPHPDEQIKVVKTSLWAEKNVLIKRYDSTKEIIDLYKNKWYLILAWEITKNSKNLKTYSQKHNKNILILWNEVDWVLDSTLEIVDETFFIPMKWIKESLNVWQSAAIFMRELWNN